MTRAATHAGTWYSNSTARLKKDIHAFLGATDAQKPTQSHLARMIVAPHAGYRYSGNVIGQAYRAVSSFSLPHVKKAESKDEKPIRRIFVFGPSHFYATKQCDLSPFSEFNTPLGTIASDHDVIAALRATKLFGETTAKQDEREHSIEMQLPFIRAQFPNVPIVPILVGNLTRAAELRYASALLPYLLDPSTRVVVSSDFCHYGPRYDFTPRPSKAMSPRAFVETLDMHAIHAISTRSATTFTATLRTHPNTICGRHAISLVLEVITQGGFIKNTPPPVRMLAYAQSHTPATHKHDDGDDDNDDDEDDTNFVSYAALALL